VDGYYEDDETVALVVSAASKLNLGAGDVLNMFGVFFVKYLKVCNAMPRDPHGPCLGPDEDRRQSRTTRWTDCFTLWDTTSKTFCIISTTCMRTSRFSDAYLARAGPLSSAESERW
jgi:hypothetical protein